MYPHHQQSIENVKRHFADDPEILALLLTGSIAHGFAGPSSDVDLALIVSDEDHRRRLATSATQFFTTELCTYPGGYVDGKYISADFIRQVAEKGSEPARFAFAGAVTLISRMDGLDDLLHQAARYPVEDKRNRIGRFYAQLEAWYWFTQEAHKYHNPYLLNTAVSKLVLFGGRMILAHNEQLYPYHKWFLRALDSCPDRPADLMDHIHAALEDPSPEHITAFFDCIKQFRGWEAPEAHWPHTFLLDSELNWLHGHTPIDDL